MQTDDRVLPIGESWIKKVPCLGTCNMSRILHVGSHSVKYGGILRTCIYFYIRKTFRELGLLYRVLGLLYRALRLLYRALRIYIKRSDYYIEHSDYYIGHSDYFIERSDSISSAEITISSAQILY